MQIDCIVASYVCKKTIMMRLISAFFRFMFASRFDVQVFFGFLGILGLIILLGSIPEEPRPIQRWPQEKSVNRSNSYRTRKTTEPYNRYKKPAWDHDRREKTQAWEDFLEELDNRGYDLWDPEAEDIWEKYN